MLHDALESVGLEMIDFQSPDLFNDLTVLCGRIREAITTKDIKGELAAMTDMEKVIYKRSGMVVRGAVIKGDSDAYITFVPKSKAHPFYKEKTIRKEILNRIDVGELLKNNIKLNINLKTSKITGDLSKEPPAEFSVSESMFTALDDKETAGIILHELGHLFFYYVFLAVGAATNSVLAEITEAYQGNPTREQKITILKTIEKGTGARFQNIDEMVNADPGTVVAVVNASCIDSIRRELGTKFYDSRLNEAMADRFSARHGAGRYIVIALDKLYRSDRSFGNNPHYRATSVAMLANAIRFSVYGAWSAVGATLNGVGVAGAVAVGIGSYVVLGALVGFALATAFGFDDTYDDIPNRYAAIRRELLAALKSPKLTKDERTRLVEDIAAIDAVIEKLSSGLALNVSVQVGSFIASYMSGRHTEFQFNRQLETLANNDLYLAASKLTI